MKSVHLALITATVAFVFIVDMSDGAGKNGSTTITAVKRRTGSDLYYLAHISSHFTCEDQETFLVEERLCMKNEDLLKGEYIHNRSMNCIIHIFSRLRWWT